MKRTVLITGASGGIGAAAARLMGSKGWQVAVHYHSGEERARGLCEELRAMGQEAAPFGADVSDMAQVKAMFREIAVRYGEIHVLVNNAGIAQQKLFTDIGEEEWDRMFDINVKGMFHCTQAALPQMIHRKSGKIINLSSIWGMVGASCEVHYSAAKAAVIGMTKALAKELGPSGIQVNCVAPGVIDTPMNGQLDEETLEALKEETPLGILGSPEHVAGVIAFLASSAADFITGQVISPNGGFVIT
ncbi:elongation factor P 5-aminopentanone reductase [Zongyangia hominis]|uniref:3-oxoacyl-ACP reductase FabG n=1 Tax=Zongyangia hominis TaxID=2763677 RepID=A0A926E9I2_9FIRM|nr:3-oxoacyl-ACP reductase FabG [Zongyangia hominis]MBC8569683.1 3-oxoacyl-ACP reductase FabG [Zongyangia hominis]